MITYAALSPHPPLTIPEIGGKNIEDVQLTVRGMQRMAEELLDSLPDTIVFLTPHGNIFSDAISCLSELNLGGDFLNFGSTVGTSIKNDLSLLAEIGKRSTDAGIKFLALDEAVAQKNRLNSRLDHGILVPLYYLQEAGMRDIPILAISIGYLPVFDLYTFGSIIKDVAANVGKRIAVVASGDMSHRLKDEGPYDYHPDGARFDELVKRYLESRDVVSILNIPENLRNNAGECGYRSLVIMLGALDGYQFESRIFGYEGPFGVGYLTAGCVPGKHAESYLKKLRGEKESKMKKIRQNESLPVRWARMILESYINKGSLPEVSSEMYKLKQQKSGVFVSLKKNGQLRGCIGTTMPVYGDISEEIASNAISAGTKDPRFLPVEKNELQDLVYSVDILGDPEPCKKNDLDPKKYGVIVSKGHKRGLLLPDLEGVNTVDEQLSIALQKAGISPGDKYNIERFEVKRFT